MNGNQLIAAEIIARLAHHGQVDKNGVDYAEHLKAVSNEAARMCAADRALMSQHVRIVGWLHDTLEDTPLEAHDLEQLGFDMSVVEAVKLLTHTHEHTHAEYVRTIRDAEEYPGLLARIVKRADLWHNSLPERYPPNRDGKSLQKRYEKAMAILNFEEA